MRALHSGISRGTETLVFRGEVPTSQREVMRAPFQEGDFPGPVKYGYLNVGVVEHGPAELRGRTVFCLYPHQTAYVVPGRGRRRVPDGVPARRAVLAGTVETAVNALWDAAPADRATGSRVVGAGMVGCCVARLLARFPGVDVELVDVDAGPGGRGRARSASSSPRRRGAAGDRDLVVHASATGAGLQPSLDLLRAEGTVIELSWYGDREVTCPLGGAFHSGRLGDPGQPGRRGRAGPPRLPDARATGWRWPWTCCATRRSTRCSPASPRSTELPEVMARLADGRLPALCHTIDYDEG